MSHRKNRNLAPTALEIASQMCEASVGVAVLAAAVDVHDVIDRHGLVANVLIAYAADALIAFREDSEIDVLNELRANTSLAEPSLRRNLLGILCPPFGRRFEHGLRISGVSKGAAIGVPLGVRRKFRANLVSVGVIVGACLLEKAIAMFSAITLLVGRNAGIVGPLLRAVHAHMLSVAGAPFFVSLRQLVAMGLAILPVVMLATYAFAVSGMIAIWLGAREVGTARDGAALREPPATPRTVVVRLTQFSNVRRLHATINRACRLGVHRGFLLGDTRAAVSSGAPALVYLGGGAS